MGSTLVINGYNTNSKTCSYVICDMINFIQKNTPNGIVAKEEKNGWSLNKKFIITTLTAIEIFCENNNNFPSEIFEETNEYLKGSSFNNTREEIIKSDLNYFRKELVKCLYELTFGNKKRIKIYWE